MKSNVRYSDQKLSRNKLANPFAETSMMDRLKLNNSVDLRDNHISQSVGNGYERIKPVDNNKRFSN